MPKKKHEHNYRYKETRAEIKDEYNKHINHTGFLKFENENSTGIPEGKTNDLQL